MLQSFGASGRKVHLPPTACGETMTDELTATSSAIPCLPGGARALSQSSCDSPQTLYSIPPGVVGTFFFSGSTSSPATTVRTPNRGMLLCFSPLCAAVCQNSLVSRLLLRTVFRLRVARGMTSRAELSLSILHSPCSLPWRLRWRTSRVIKAWLLIAWRSKSSSLRLSRAGRRTPSKIYSRSCASSKLQLPHLRGVISLRSQHAGVTRFASLTVPRHAFLPPGGSLPSPSAF